MMVSKRLIILATLILIWGVIVPAAARTETADPGALSVSDLEEELTDIEEELTGLEEEIDKLLEDLVDPRITSLTVFFSAQNLRGQLPASLHLHMDGELLTTREFNETDRLVLVKGGAVEVYSGVAEPATHDLNVQCFLSPGETRDSLTSTGVAMFRFEARRATANYLEITLTEDTARRAPSYKLNARHWSKEP